MGNFVQSMLANDCLWRVSIYMIGHDNVMLYNKKTSAVRTSKMFQC